MSDKGYETEAAAELDPNECELTLDLVDKIALRLMAAMMPNTGYYNKESGNSQAYDAYEAANDFLKEKLKRDTFELVVDALEEAGVDEEDFTMMAWVHPEVDDDQKDDDDEPAAVVKPLGPGKIRHLVVNDIPVASIGSFCSSEKYRKKDTSYWSAEGLQKAADDINEGVELQEQEEEDRPPIAVVQEDCAGHYLVVDATTVCRTGDRCKDPHFRNSGLTYWTTEALELVAEGINKEL